ncbi:hypothetical protein [Streptomyces sp. NPDC003077]|uniref:hypothetical protein n=1 Tax=Streptomyces sp. NPDC003077 TaxID=3154443 RepID=UPI0033B3092B
MNADKDHDLGPGEQDERDLRALLRSAVSDLEPAPDALDHLRRAVPARRRRRRHALVGTAAALLLCGMSVPAMVHVVDLDGGSGDHPANAASSQRTPGGASGTHGEGTEGGGMHPTSGPVPGKPTESAGPKGRDKAPEKHGDRTRPETTAPAPAGTMDATSPTCVRRQLGRGSGTVGPADAQGRVYGAFRVVNTSQRTCSVDGGGTVGALAQGSTDLSRVHVVDHTSGDAATGLPDPTAMPDELVLKPGQAYEVKFAWIPEDGGCATPGTSPSPTPSSEAPAGTPSDTNSADVAPNAEGNQAGGNEGAPGDVPAPGGVVLSHTPEAGEPAAADATITDACAGTVYRTGALPAQ